MFFEIDFLESHDEASIIAELQRIARERGTPRLTSKDIDTYGKISSRTVFVKFGSLRTALDAAGLRSARFTKATDEELFREIAKLWTITLREHGRRPRAKEMEKYRMPVSSKTVMERFGTWKKALAATARAMNGAAVVQSGEALTAVKRPAPKKTKRKVLSVARRFDVFKRDGYKCRICRKVGGELEVDHIVPVAKGGRNTMDNLQTVCRPCNRSKGTRLM